MGPTFSAIKRKFGGNVRSRAGHAMANEVLAELVRHNLCVVHRSHVELGIEAVFRQDERGEPADVPPLVRPV